MGSNRTNTRKEQPLLHMRTKIIAIALLLTIVVVFSVSVSYAWISLSNSPAVSGTQVTLAGGTTILLAPDLTRVIYHEGEEVEVHYPGKFDDLLVFSNFDSYDYLNGLAGLAPISTADGVYWIMPDRESSGGGTGSANYTVDSRLQYANLQEPHTSGSYAYLDFWVVSPGSDYKLRVSSDVKSGEGSSMVELPKVVSDENAVTGLSLEFSESGVSTFARVGFLANEDPVEDLDMLAYTRSADFEERYSRLIGQYQGKGEEADPKTKNKFTIYEPNGSRHCNTEYEDGGYVATFPIGYFPAEERFEEINISKILTVQLTSEWKTLEEGYYLEQIFQAGLSGKNDATKENAFELFFDDYLQGLITPYINSGRFVSNTSTLYSNLDGRVVAAQRMSEHIMTAGATDDVFITILERNTPQRIRMFIWLEGQDVDCMPSNSEPMGFVLNLELAGELK